MKLSAKQASLSQIIKAGYKIILLEGPVGTSKTYVGAVAMLTLALHYPKSRIFVGRLTMPDMRIGTMPSFQEAAMDMNLVSGYHYKVNRSQGFEHFHFVDKDSQIFFKEMNHIKDPNYLKLKGPNLSCAMIDEADGIVEGYFDMLNSRVGRANKNGVPDFVLLTCNANEGWIKDRIYNKYKWPEKYGELPSDVAVVEFELEDSFLPDDYYMKQMGNPLQWVERYLNNNWSYGDDIYSLFKYKHMDAIHTKEVAEGIRSLGIDAARTHDRTCGGLWQGDTLKEIVIFKGKNVDMDYDQQAEIIHDYCVRNNIGYQNIWIDGVGEGQGLITALKSKYGWEVNIWVSNSVSESKLKLERELQKATDDFKRRQVRQKYPVTYADLRSEQAYLFSVDIESENVRFYETCPNLADFKKEATMHNHKDDGKKFKLEAKDKVKERTQFSPDIFDCVLMGRYGQRKAQAIGSYTGKGSGGGKSSRLGSMRGQGRWGSMGAGGSRRREF